MPSVKLPTHMLPEFVHAIFLSAEGRYRLALHDHRGQRGLISENATPRDSHAEQSVASDGLVQLASPFTVAETLDRRTAAVRGHGGTVFARINHSAADVGLAMRPTQVLIFGNPKVGTRVMQAAPTLAIDLPFKALGWPGLFVNLLLRWPSDTPGAAFALSGCST